MPTTFKVFYLGNHADIDPTEGNNSAENAGALVGQSFGSSADPMLHEIQTFSPGSTGFGNGTTSKSGKAYDTNSSAGDTFKIDGGPDQDFDSLAVYNATLTYSDGTTANITAVVFQDTNGNTYLAPEMSDNADQAKLEAAPIESMKLGTVVASNNILLVANRETFDPVTCFVETTRLLTPNGPLMIKDLVKGDMLVTASGVHRPIRWIGRSTRVAAGNLTPIRIRAGALGPGVPAQDLRVSREHRIRLRSRIVERMLGVGEVLVPAIDLLELPGVTLDPSQIIVTYMHVLLDEHDLIIANGAVAETLLFGSDTCKIMGRDAIAEIKTKFPDIPKCAAVPAITFLQGQRARKLVARHAANGRALTVLPPSVKHKLRLGNLGVTV